MMAMWRRRNKQRQAPSERRYADTLSFDWIDSCLPWECFRNFRTTWCRGSSRDSDRSCLGPLSTCCGRAANQSLEAVEGPSQENSTGPGCICPLGRKDTNTVPIYINTDLDKQTPRQRHGQFCFGRWSRTYAVERKRSQSFNGSYSKLIQSSFRDTPVYGDYASQRCLNPLAQGRGREEQLQIDRIRYLTPNTRNILRKSNKEDDVVFFQGCCGYATFSSDCCSGHPYLSRCQSLSDSLISSKRDYDIVFFRGKCGYASFDPNCCRLLETMHYNMRVNIQDSPEKRTDQRVLVPTPPRSSILCPVDINMSTPSEDSEECVEIPVFKSQTSSQSFPEILILSSEQHDETPTGKRSVRVKKHNKGLKRSKTSSSIKKALTLAPVPQKSAKLKTESSNLTIAEARKTPKKVKVKHKQRDKVLDSQAETLTSEANTLALVVIEASNSCSQNDRRLNTEQTDAVPILTSTSGTASLSETDVQNMAAEISYHAINAAIVECENSENNETCMSTQTVSEATFLNELVYVHLTVSPTFECDYENFRQLLNHECEDIAPDIDEDIKDTEIITNPASVERKAPSDRGTCPDCDSHECNTTLNHVNLSIKSESVQNNDAELNSFDNQMETLVSKNKDGVLCKNTNTKYDPNLSVTDAVLTDDHSLEIDNTSTQVQTLAISNSHQSATKENTNLENVEDTPEQNLLSEETPDENELAESSEKVQDPKTMEQDLISSQLKKCDEQRSLVRQDIQNDDDDLPVKVITNASELITSENILSNYVGANQNGLTTQESGGFEVLSDPNYYFMSDSGKSRRRFTFEQTSPPDDMDHHQTSPSLSSCSDEVFTPCEQMTSDTSKTENYTLEKTGIEECHPDLEITTETDHKTEKDKETSNLNTDSTDLSTDMKVPKGISTTINTLVEGSTTRSDNIRDCQNLLPSNPAISNPTSIYLETTQDTKHTNGCLSGQKLEGNISNEQSSSVRNQTSLSMTSPLVTLFKSNQRPTMKTFTTGIDKSISHMTLDKAVTDKFNNPQDHVRHDGVSHYDPRVDIFVAETIVKAVNELCGQCGQCPSAQIQPQTLESVRTDSNLVTSVMMGDDPSRYNSEQKKLNAELKRHEYVTKLKYLREDPVNKNIQAEINASTSEELDEHDSSKYNPGTLIGNAGSLNIGTTTGKTENDVSNNLEENICQSDEISVDSLEMSPSQSMSRETKSAVQSHGGKDEMSLANASEGCIDNSPLLMTDSMSHTSREQSNGKPEHIALVPAVRQAGYMCTALQINTSHQPLAAVISSGGDLSSEASDICRVTVPSTPSLVTCGLADNNPAINNYRERERYVDSRRQEGESDSQIPLHNCASWSAPAVFQSVTVSGPGGNHSLETQYDNQTGIGATAGAGIYNNVSDDRNEKPYSHVNTVLTGVEHKRALRYIESTSSTGEVERNESITSGNHYSGSTIRQSGFIESSTSIGRSSKSELCHRAWNSSLFDAGRNARYCVTPLSRKCLTENKDVNDGNRLKICVSSRDLDNNTVIPNEHGTQTVNIHETQRHVDILTIDFTQEAELFSEQLHGDDIFSHETDPKQLVESLDAYGQSAETSSLYSDPGTVVSYGAHSPDPTVSITGNTLSDFVPTTDERTLLAEAAFRDSSEVNPQFNEQYQEERVPLETTVLRPCSQTFESSLSFEIAEGIVNGEDKGDNSDRSCVSDYIREYNELCKSSLENERRILRSVLESVRDCYSPCSPPEHVLPSINGLPGLRSEISSPTEQSRADSPCIIKHRSNRDYKEANPFTNGNPFCPSNTDIKKPRVGIDASRRTDDGFSLFRAITEETEEQLEEECFPRFETVIVFSDPKQTPDHFQNISSRKGLQRQKRIDKPDYSVLAWSAPPGKSKVGKRQSQVTLQSNSLGPRTDSRVHKASLYVGSLAAVQGDTLLKKTHTNISQKCANRAQDTIRGKSKTLKRQDSKRPGTISSSLKALQSTATPDISSSGGRKDSGDIVVIQNQRSKEGGIVKEDKHLKTKRKVTNQRGTRKHYRTYVVSGICDGSESPLVDQGKATESPDIEHVERNKRTYPSDVKGRADTSKSEVTGSDNCNESHSGAKPKGVFPKVRKMSRSPKDSTDARRKSKSRTSVRSSDRYEDVAADKQYPELVSLSAEKPEVSESDERLTDSRYEEVTDDQTNFDQSRFEDVTGDMDEWGTSPDGTLSAAKHSEADGDLNSNDRDSVNVMLPDRHSNEMAVSDTEYLNLLAQGQLSFMQDLESWREAYNLNADDIERDALKLLAGDFTNLYDDLPDVDKAEVTKEIAHMDSMTNDDLMNSLR